MTGRGYTLLDTALGSCAIAWGVAGIIGIQLPYATVAAARARMARRHPDLAEGLPPGDVQQAIDAIAELLAGAPRDLDDVALDMDAVPPFERSVYEAARTIPPGRTVTYGELAARLGMAGAAREVGQALGRNPFPPVVPCHRIVAAGGKLGGFSAPGGNDTKRRMLAIERARAEGAPDLFDAAS